MAIDVRILTDVRVLSVAETKILLLFSVNKKELKQSTVVNGIIDDGKSAESRWPV